MKLRYSRGALADLDEIFSYISRDNPKAAGRLVERIERVAALLADRPLIGRTARDIRFRSFPVGNYLDRL